MHGKITCFQKDGSTTHGVDIDQGFLLGAGVAGKPGCFYYVIFQDGNSGDKVSPIKAYLIHAKLDGSCILKKELDCSKEKIDIYEWH